MSKLLHRYQVAKQDLNPGLMNSKAHVLSMTLLSLKPASKALYQMTTNPRVGWLSYKAEKGILIKEMLFCG